MALVFSHSTFFSRKVLLSMLLHHIQFMISHYSFYNATIKSYMREATVDNVNKM